jgi:hypothetical protein
MNQTYLVPNRTKGPQVKFPTLTVEAPPPTKPLTPPPPKPPRPAAPPRPKYRFLPEGYKFFPNETCRTLGMFFICWWAIPVMLVLGAVAAAPFRLNSNLPAPAGNPVWRLRTVDDLPVKPYWLETYYIQGHYWVYDWRLKTWVDP